MLASKGQAKSLQSLFPRFPFKKNAFPFLALQPACRDGSKKIQDGSKHFFSGGLSSAVCTRQFSHANFHNWALGLHTLICTLAEFKVLGCPTAPHCVATSLLGVWWFAAFQQYCCATVVMKGTPIGGVGTSLKFGKISADQLAPLSGRAPLRGCKRRHINIHWV